MRLWRSSAPIPRLPTVAVVSLGLMLSACATNAPKAVQRVGAVPAAFTPLQDVSLTPHGAMPYHRPLALPPSGPYGVRSDGRYLPVYRGTDSISPRLFVDTQNPLGQAMRMPVTRIHRRPDGSQWLRVLLPDEGMGPAGWVLSDDVHVVTLRERLVVDLSSYTLRHYRDGKLLHRFTVGIGRPEFPTPMGTYFIWAQIPQAMPNGPYGVFALGTSAFSPTIDDGRVGIHGTADPTDRGHRVSHGCIRVYNVGMTKLRNVPLGTPLVIRR